MKYSQAISILSALAGLTSAAPAAEPRQFKAVITFTGAAASYTLDVPTDSTLFQTSKSLKRDQRLVFSHYRSSFVSLMWCSCDLTLGADNNLAVDTITSQGGATCSFFGVDGATVTIVGAHSATVAPPQAIQSGSCLAL